jgi:hypothetical protein
LTSQARQALEAHDYANAERNASMAVRAFEALNLSGRREQALTLQQMAGRGLRAVSDLQYAREHRQVFNLPQAQAEARQAGETLAGLGDSPRVAEANAVLAELWQWQRAAGLAALGGGAMSVVLGVYSVLRIRKREAIRKLAAGANRQFKEDPSWL